MTSKKSPGSVVSIGVVSLITVFVVLMLTSFSVLIVSSSGADLDLANKTALSITNYYKADSDAEKILQKLDEIRISSEMPIYEIEGIEILEKSRDENGIILTYIVGIDAKKQLEIDVLMPFDKNENIKRLRWQTVAIEILIL